MQKQFTQKLFILIFLGQEKELILQIKFNKEKAQWNLYKYILKHTNPLLTYLKETNHIYFFLY